MIWKEGWDLKFTITDDEGNSFSSSFQICHTCGYVCPDALCRRMESDNLYCPQCWHRMAKVVYTRDMMKLTVDMVSMFMEAMTSKAAEKPETASE